MPTVPREQFMFCGPTYNAASPIIDAQRSINLYPETQMQSSAAPVALIGTPGLTTVADLSSVPKNPIRGIWYSGANPVGNLVYLVAGDTCYTLNTDTGVTAAQFAVGGGATYATTNGMKYPCRFVYDGTRVLVFDSFNSTLYDAGGVVRLTGCIDVCFLDGYVVAIGNASFNRMVSSAFLDGTTWPGLSVAQRVGASDQIKRIEVLNNQLWVFGTKVIDVWYNAGLPNFPFARIDGSTIEVGISFPSSIQRVGQSLIFAGSASPGYTKIYRTNGFRVETISTPAIESQMATLMSTSLGTSLDAWSTRYSDAGHEFYVLTLWNQSVSPFYYTFCYDVTTGEWHERQSVGKNYWDVSSVVSMTSNNGFSSAYLTPLLAGSASSGKIYRLTRDSFLEDGVPLNYQRTAPHINNQRKRVFYKSLEVAVDPALSGAMSLSYSNDAGKTFAAGPSLNLSTETPIKRIKWYQLGQSRDRVFQVSGIVSSGTVRIADAILNVAPSTED